MKNILLVFTGGTIGSEIKDNEINISTSVNSKLVHMFTEHYETANTITFKVIKPLQILSENLNPQHWQVLISAISLEDLSQFNAVIITHGTDTLAFTAAALGLYFNRLSIPMLVVSSDLPLEQPQANGLANFICAIEFIKHINQSGVFVCYKNPHQPPKIYLATRLASCLQLSSDFIGIQNQALMTYENDTFSNVTVLPPLPSIVPPLTANFSARILLIKPYPGLSYNHFNLDNVDAVLHDLYHSGTASTNDEFGLDFSLLEFMQQCEKRKLPVYLAPAIKTDAAYATTKALLSGNAEMIWNMSLETAYVKLLLAFGNFQDRESISAFLVQDLAYEHVNWPIE